MSEEEMIRLANEKQRALTDEQVLAYFSCCPPDVETGREILTNEFYDQLVEKYYPEQMKPAPRENRANP